MDKLKAVINEKVNFRDKNVLFYMVACAIVVLQPLLDIISSAVINLGKSNFISVSGAVRAILMLLILVYSIAFYNGKYKKICSAYLSGVFAYIFLVCLMTAIRGTAVACVYMIGLLADTFFFHFAFVAIVELYYTVGRRISPLVTTAISLIYALTLAINYLLDKTGTFNFSSSFATSLALLIPAALVFVVSRIGKTETNDKTAKILSYVIPIICGAFIFVGAVLSNSRPVLFISVIFSVIFFVWSFSGWRNSSNPKRSKNLLKSFVSSALFCVLILAFLPISPIKSSFDGTFKFSELFYTYNGNTQTGIPSGDSGDDMLPFDDEDDGGNDYIPILDSGYDPNDDRDDEDEESDTNTDIASDSTSGISSTVEETSTDEFSTSESEPAGDESTSEEASDTTQEETTNRWQIPSINMSDIDNFLSTLPISNRPSEQTTESAVDDTQSQSTEQSSDKVDNTNSSIPPAAIGVGAMKLPSGNILAINLDRVKYFGDSFFGGNLETWIFGLRFSSLFNEDLSPALKVKSDLFSVFFNYGILGFILYVLPIAFIFLKILKFILFNFSSVFESIGFMTYVFGAFAILGLSVFEGDVFAFSAVGSVAGVLLANTFTLCEEKTKATETKNKQ